MSTIRFFTPVADDKNLGKTYNRVMSQLKPGEWACIRDCDTCFLTRVDWILAEMQAYIKQYPKCGLFTCLTNRVGQKEQLYKGKLSNESDMQKHLKIAKACAQRKREAPVAKRPTSGFLMLISYDMWKAIGGFRETSDTFLHVDWNFAKKAKKYSADNPRVMQTIYLFHVYRLGTHKNDISHLT